MRKVWLDKTSNFSSRITEQLRTHFTVPEQPMELEEEDVTASSFGADDDLLGAIMQEGADIPSQERVRRIESILSAFLLSTAVPFEQRKSIQKMLMRKYNWTENSFAKGITLQCLKDLTIDISLIQYITDQKSPPIRAKVY